jgi:Fic family protein
VALQPKAKLGTEAPRPPRQTDLFVPLSKPAADILARVTKPVTHRKPVGYDFPFLDRYRPNTTFYLSASERKHLASLGVTSMPTGAAGTYAQHVLQRLLIDLSWNSSRLEGNTYSLLETERLIELNEAAEGKSQTDAQMIRNHKAAIEFLVQSASDIAFDRRTILNLHATLADNLLSDPRAPGRLRTKPVGISGSVFHPLANPVLIAEYFDQVLATANAITDPFEQSLFVMVQLPYLQPFDDVNKRTSRLAANIPLVRQNLSPLSFVDLPDTTYTHGMLGVYELNRTDLIKDAYLWAYERSAHRYASIRQTLGDPDPFRLRHRAKLKQVVAEVVSEKMDQQRATTFIATWTKANIELADRPRFVEVAETELMALHEGNFARYAIRPSQFDAWYSGWKAKVKSPKDRPQKRR